MDVAMAREFSNEVWLGRFIRVGIEILEQVDLSLPIDANLQLCEALERCNEAEKDLLDSLEPGQSHHDKLSEELPTLIRESSATDLSGMWQELHEVISLNIALRSAAAKDYPENGSCPEAKTSKYRIIHENLSRLVNETIHYRRELSRRIDQLSSLAQCTICDLKPEQAFQFIGNAQVRGRIVKMHRELEVIEREQLYVSGTVILRSIMESVLVWALLQNKGAALSAYRAYRAEIDEQSCLQGASVVIPPIEKWGWDELVHVGRRTGIISQQATLDACIYFNSCRNRIHPWYARNKGEEPSAKTYIVGKIAYRSLLTELDCWRHNDLGKSVKSLA
jgi:hypothetical protein